jgi:hypothetical protein
VCSAVRVNADSVSSAQSYFRKVCLENSRRKLYWAHLKGRSNRASASLSLFHENAK